MGHHNPIPVPHSMIISHTRPIPMSIQNSHSPLVFISLTATLNERGKGILKCERFIYEGSSLIFYSGQDGSSQKVINPKLTPNSIRVSNIKPKPN